jgi:hypothetical protein
VDHVSAAGFELWGPKGLGQWLKNSQVRTSSLQQVFRSTQSGYPTHDQLTQDLKNIAANHPGLAKMFSIGKSTQGRDLWVMKISKNVQTDDNRPEFKYVANMHGDEIVGREMMVLLIKDLLENYGKDSAVTKLVDTTQIYILPSMNPDGATAVTRYTADYVDLNRSFPDWSTSDNLNTPQGRAIETQAMMAWEKSRHFVLSANFHGGAEVVNYPWDSMAQPHPLDAQVKALSLAYANLVPYLRNSTSFQNGITNGWAWYQINGGMQDWSWYYHRDLQLTIELSETKWPDYSSVGGYYQANRAALLDFIAQAQKIKLSVF